MTSSLHCSDGTDDEWPRSEGSSLATRRVWRALPSGRTHDTRTGEHRDWAGPSSRLDPLGDASLRRRRYVPSQGERNQIESYVAENDAHSRNYLALVSDLRRAVGNEGLLLHYQPKRSLKDGEFVGVEALVRWSHPDLGLLPPADFIPMAEREGIMRDLTIDVIDRALAQQRQWRESGHRIPVAVNLSPASLLDSRLPDDVRALVSRHETTPADLELEITEDTLMQDPIALSQ